MRSGEFESPQGDSEEQMVAILREADRTSMAETAKKHKVSGPTIYAWRKHFGQLEVADVKRLKVRIPRHGGHDSRLKADSVPA